MKYRYEIKTKLGIITLIEKDGKLNGIYYGKEKETIPSQKTSLFILTEQQLSEYFEGKRQNFTLPLALEGTEFQKKVWQALQKIPYI